VKVKMSEELRYFVPQVESILSNLENLKLVLMDLITQIRRHLRTGMEIDKDLLETLFDTYYQLAIKVQALHREWVIEPYITSGIPPETPPETIVEEIVLKLFEFTKEYEKVVMKFNKASDDEKIDMLKSLISSIKKYEKEISDLITDLEIAVSEREEFGETEEETII
jgi:hypothetical protein